MRPLDKLQFCSEPVFVGCSNISILLIWLSEPITGQAATGQWPWATDDRGIATDHPQRATDDPWKATDDPQRATDDPWRATDDPWKATDDP